MKIYVGNLSSEVTEQDLRQEFEAFGGVDSVSVITDKYSGRSKGFAFVEMSSVSEGQAAITGLNGKTLKERTLTVNAARGIDVLSISHVINYDMPATTDDYIHRIGRTGRVNNNGDAFTFVTDSDTDMVNSLERILKKKIERRKLDNFDYSKSAPAQNDTRRNSRFMRKPDAIRNQNLVAHAFSR